MIWKILQVGAAIGAMGIFYIGVTLTLMKKSIYVPGIQ
jgi:hypothetical protein